MGRTGWAVPGTPRTARQGWAVALRELGQCLSHQGLGKARRRLFPRGKLLAGAPGQPRSINSWEKGRQEAVDFRQGQGKGSVSALPSVGPVGR